MIYFDFFTNKLRKYFDFFTNKLMIYFYIILYHFIFITIIILFQFLFYSFIQFIVDFQFFYYLRLLILNYFAIKNLFKRFSIFNTYKCLYIHSFQLTFYPSFINNSYIIPSLLKYDPLDFYSFDKDFFDSAYSSLDTFSIASDELSLDTLSIPDSSYFSSQIIPNNHFFNHPLFFQPTHLFLDRNFNFLTYSIYPQFVNNLL